MFAGSRREGIRSKVFTKVGGNGLLTRPSLSFADVDDELLQVDALKSNTQNSGLAH